MFTDLLLLHLNHPALFFDHRVILLVNELKGLLLAPAIR
jgi:hypothetical protein